MRSAALTFWDVPAGQLPLTWLDAQQRLAEQARADGASAGHTPAADMSTIPPPGTRAEHRKHTRTNHHGNEQGRRTT
jgi:hypothetical protein